MLKKIVAFAVNALISHYFKKYEGRDPVVIIDDLLTKSSEFVKRTDNEIDDVLCLPLIARMQAQLQKK